MPRLRFDKKFGEDALDLVPSTPGVYLFLDQKELIYVGKAKNLKKRLAQYKAARGNKKKQRKMSRIVHQADTLLWKPLSSEKEALLKENKLIQKFQPSFNVAGAYSFLYPCIALDLIKDTLHLSWTTRPGELLSGDRFGVFRSKGETLEAYKTICHLFGYISHRKNLKSHLDYTVENQFRCFPLPLVEPFQNFLRGENLFFLEALFHHLLEKPSARENAETISVSLKELRQFFQSQTRPIFNCFQSLNQNPRFIDQNELDALLIESKNR